MRRSACLVLLVSSLHQTAAGDELMDLPLEQLQTITISSLTRTPLPSAQAPAVTSMFSAEQLRTMGVRTLADVLAYVPGLSTLSRPNAERRLVVRGLAPANGVLVLVDGQPANAPLTGAYAFYDRPIDDLDRIEIVRGPGSAIFGGNALLAVINLITHDPQREAPAIDAHLGTGSASGQLLSLYGRTRDRSAPLQLQAGYSWRQSEGDALLLASDRIYTPTAGRYLPPYPNPSLTPTKRHQPQTAETGLLRAQWRDWSARYSYGYLQTEPRLSFRKVVTPAGTTIQADEQHLVELNGEVTTGTTLSWQPRLYYSWHDSRTLGLSEPRQVLPDANQDGRDEIFASGIIENLHHQTSTRGAELTGQWQLQPDRTRLALDLTAERTRLDRVHKDGNVRYVGFGTIALFPSGDLTAEYLRPDIDRELLAAALELQYTVADWRLTAGARQSHYSDFGDNLSPRLGLFHPLGPNWSAKLLYAEAFKPPSFIELYDQTPTLTPFRVQGNPALDPTTIRTTEAQLNGRLSADTDLSLTWFSNRTDNEIFFNDRAGVQQWQNSGKRQSQGLEAELSGRWQPFGRYFLNYALQDTSSANRGEAADIHPRHRLNAGTETTLTSRLTLFTGFNHYSRAPREAGDPRPPVRAKTDIQLALTAHELLPELRVQLAVQNLLGHHRRDELAADAGITDDLPREGRQFWLTVEYRP